jgi:hypothetical protein
MSANQGSIAYGSPAAKASAGPAFVGARNGLSLDADGFVVLGEDIGDAGVPAIVTSSREIPLSASFYLNIFGGGDVIISAEATTPKQGLLQVVNAFGGGVLVQADAPFDVETSYFLASTNDGASTLLTVGTQSAQDNRLLISMFDSVHGTEVVIIAAQSYIGDVPSLGGSSVIKVSPEYEILSGTNQFVSFVDDSVILSIGGTNTFTSFLSGPGAGTLQAGDTLNGFVFQGPEALFSGVVNAFTSTVGNVLFSTLALTSGGSPSNVGIWGVLNPTARLHIGAGVADAGGGPLKLTAGPLVAVPEDGLIEYDGTNFFKTIGATRTIIV